MRENGEGMEGRLDSISQAYARRRTSVSRTHLLSPGMWVNVRRDAMTPVPLDSTNVLLFRSRNLIPLTRDWTSCDLRYSREVNGKDVSNSSHEDAVRCFQSAQEPIIVEVLRRPSSEQVPHTPSKVHENITRQDKNETTIERSMTNEQMCNNDVNKHNMTCNVISTSVQTDWAGLIEVEELFPVPFVVEEQANDSFEDFLTHDIDFEVL
ncbi:PZRN4 protein, partial [Acromyrmex heyeri]